ncbi:MTRF1L release factor glutamine methyltransferase [Apodemus speciosus]|uniref:MTRF1L release factor glutamine methyltransferase n=1 Tax=Apodemus speciosus TaxID=105296 RepID=A0ABQ0F5V2_APOSI
MELVEWVLEEVAQRPHAVRAQDGPLILEVGCGSGAIALSLLSQLPQSQVIAVDKEEAAVTLTHENAQRLRLQDRIRVIRLDITSEGRCTSLLPWSPMDLVVSNPPYVFRKDMEQLAPEIRSYEDLVALDGGDEGMDIITHILTLAPRLLNASGSIFLEVDPRHPELVSSWLQSHPDLHLSLVGVREDFCGSAPVPACPEDYAIVWLLCDHLARILACWTPGSPCVGAAQGEVKSAFLSPSHGHGSVTSHDGCF